jgi:hypothetical protein
LRRATAARLLQELKYEDNPELFDKLGLERTAQLFQLVAANDPGGKHSEIRILDLLDLALTEARGSTPKQ